MAAVTSQGYNSQSLINVPLCAEVLAYWDDFFESRYKREMEKRGLTADIGLDEYLDWWDMELKRIGK